MPVDVPALYERLMSSSTPLTNVMLAAIAQPVGKVTEAAPDQTSPAEA